MELTMQKILVQMKVRRMMVLGGVVLSFALAPAATATGRNPETSCGVGRYYSRLAQDMQDLYGVGLGQAAHDLDIVIGTESVQPAHEIIKTTC